MHLQHHLFKMTAIFGCLLIVVQCVAASGPVFVNPEASVAVPAPSGNSLVTQTVYGFLDFTTTIGNTVMVFSPQSAAPVVPQVVPNVQVIDTKPVQNQPAISIQPSKTVQKPQENKPKSEPPKKIASVVQIQSQSPPIYPSKIEVIAQPKSQINIVEGNVKNVPISSIVEVKSHPKIVSKVEVVQPSQILSSKMEVFEGGPPSLPTPVSPQYVVNSVVEVKSDEEPALIGNNIGEPEYDFLSRQPSEVVEETYKVINLKPSTKFHLKPRVSLPGQTKAQPGHHQQQHHPSHPASPGGKRADAHPTGLVTKLGGTVVKDGATTVHETSVIGTYISGKYAQVLQSTSHIINQNHKPKINASPSLRILKTAAPTFKGQNHKHHHLEPTPAGSFQDETIISVEGNNLIKSTRRPTGPGGRSANFKPQFRNRKIDTEEEDDVEQEIVSHQHGGYKKSARPRATQTLRPFKHNKFSRTSAELATVSVFSEQQTNGGSGRRYQSSRRHGSNKRSSSSTPGDAPGATRRGYKPRVSVEPTSAAAAQAASTSLYKFKLNRAPGRWQYKTTPKPRVTIRRQGEDDGEPSPQVLQGSTTPLDVNYSNEATPSSRSDDLDLNQQGSETSNANISDDGTQDANKIEEAFPLETIKVEISTPADFKNVYYELATIKSPYTFQVGSVKNTRYITVTSTFERTLEPTESATLSPTATEPLSENILTSANYEKDNNLESGIATLPAVYLASDMATPPLETLTETFSTTQDMLKTHVLPVIRGPNETASYTLVQTYHVTRIVTATKTLPPMEAYHFVPSKTLKDFNSHLDEAGSELHLELEFGDDNEQDSENQPRRSFPPDLNLANVGSEFDLSDVDKNRLLEGHLRLKKAHAPSPKSNSFQEQQPQQQQTPTLSPEQLQQLAILRLLNPAAAAQAQIITTSRPVVKIDTVYESHVVSLFNGISTTLSTISRPVGTVTKTEFEYGTSTLAIPGLPQALPPALPPLNPLNPFAPAPQYSVTSTPVVTQTVVTETDSKILKLTFGAKTAYTTITSTRVVPTILTTYVTASVPVAPSVGFPGYFPAPYPAFPYVG